MVLLTVFILVAGANAGRYGLDRWVLPYLRQRWTDKMHRPHRPVVVHK